MKTLFTSARFRTGLAVLGLATVCLPIASQVAVSAEVPNSSSPHDVAVAQYLAGAASELEAYRAEIKTRDAAKEAEKPPTLAEARLRLRDCDQLLANLKSAPASQFDLIKADYERSRSLLAKALETAP